MHGGKVNLAEALDHMLAVHVAGGSVVEDQHDAGKAGQRGRAQVGKAGNAGHLDLDGDGDLALDLLGRAARPLGDDLDVVVGDVGIGFNRQGAEGDDAPRGEDDRAAQHQPAAPKSEIDDRANHLGSPLGSACRRLGVCAKH